MIELIKITKAYNDIKVIKNLSFKAEKGKITVLIGPSGCGKTTTLKMINRLIEPTSGKILINGKNIEGIDPINLRRNIGYVIQEIGLFPHYSVYDNIATVPRLLKWKEIQIAKRVRELLDLFNLPFKEYAVKYPSELSGGERQRVGVARALAANPDILLMDEPFGAIDPINRRILQDFFIEIQNKLGKTVVFVTHDIEEAIKIGDRIAIMRSGELVQIGNTTDVIEHPKNSFVEELLGSDKDIRRLMLLKARDYIPVNFSNGPSDGTSDNRITVKQKGKEVSVKFMGKWLKKPFIASPNDNLLDIFTGLLRSGTKIAVIVSSSGELNGIIKLNDIIDVMSNEND